MTALRLRLAGFAVRWPDDVDGLATGAGLLDEVEIPLVFLLNWVFLPLV